MKSQKNFKNIALIIVIVLVVGLVVKDFMIKQIIVSVGSSMLGAPLKIEGFSLSLLGSKVRMKNLVIYNPDHFTKNPLINIAHIEVHYHLMALLSGKMHFSLIDLDVRQLAVERNQAGEYNVASLKIKPQKSSDPLDMNIAVLKLNVDQVTFRDEAQGGEMKETSRGVGLKKKTFKNITSPQQLVALVLFESSGVGPLKNMAMGLTKGIVGELTGLTGDVAGTAKDTVQSVFGTLKSVVDK